MSHKSFANTQRGLDNGSREWLLGEGLGPVAIVIDALIRIWGVGQRFTFRQAQQELQAFGIGHRSLREALNCEPRGRRLFPYAGVQRAPKGRPAQLFELPSPAEVASRLAQARTYSDFLDDAALRGLAAYRSALHREHIKRNPGEHSRGFLASRLGVSKRTVRTYDKKERIDVTPQFKREVLTRSDVLALPDSVAEGTRFEWLEVKGRSYPGIRSLAIQFLVEKKEVYLVTQKVNRYAFREQTAETAVSRGNDDLRHVWQAASERPGAANQLDGHRMG